MMGIFSQNYMTASAQAKAVRAYLEMHDGVEPSWDKEDKAYAPVHIAEWHNGREEGYVVVFRNRQHVQLNIAFFEHRNSDSICALEWVQTTMNPPTIDTADFGGKVYKTKWDVSHQVEVGEAMKMADWIMERLCQHWAAA
jgi:hypothetical protein